MALGSAFVQTEISHGSKEPGPQGERGASRLVVLAGERAMGAHHGVLHNLLCIEGVLQDAVGIAVQRRLEAVDQPLERSFLTAVDRHRQVLFRELEGGRFAARPGVLHASNNTPFAHSVRFSV